MALAVDDALNFDASQRAKESLRASEESFRLIVDSIPAFAWYASPDGKIEYLNMEMRAAARVEKEREIMMRLGEGATTLELYGWS